MLLEIVGLEKQIIVTQLKKHQIPTPLLISFRDTQAIKILHSDLYRKFTYTVLPRLLKSDSQRAPRLLGISLKVTSEL